MTRRGLIANADRVKAVGLLQQLGVPDRNFHTVQTGFEAGLLSLIVSDAEMRAIVELLAEQQITIFFDTFKARAYDLRRAP